MDNARANRNGNRIKEIQTINESPEKKTITMEKYPRNLPNVVVIEKLTWFKLNGTKITEVIRKVDNRVVHSNKRVIIKDNA